MNLHPILAALKKHKPSVALIALQIAVTLAIVCNAVFIIGQRVGQASRPTGLVEQDLFVISQSYADAPKGTGAADVARLDAMQRADLAKLRGLADVTSAAAVNSVPLSETNVTLGGVTLKRHQRSNSADTAFYFGDAQALQTLGLRLVAGRNFTPEEVQHYSDSIGTPPVVIVTQALARKLFPHGSALGRSIYLSTSAKPAPTTIVGVVARLQATDNGDGASAWYSVLEPARLDYDFTTYAVRAKPGRMAAAMREARKALYQVDPLRTLENSFRGVIGIVPYSEVRANAYRADKGMAIVMGVISVILLAITGAGMVGVTSFWVSQRRRQIGIRRALGATRADILRYFQVENLVIAGGGVVLGAILGIGLNLWLMHRFSMDRMPVWYVLVGIVVLLVLGQTAAYAPARRAARVPPVVATRSV